MAFQDALVEVEQLTNRWFIQQIKWESNGYIEPFWLRDWPDASLGGRSCCGVGNDYGWGLTAFST